MDIPIILAALPFQSRFAAKKQLFRYPFLGWRLRRSGHIPIDRENPHAAVKSLRDAADMIKDGAPILIFPEGATSRDGSIKPFKGGGFMLATKSGAEAVPVTIRGSRAVLVPRTYHVRGGSVEIVIGQPIRSERDTTDFAILDFVDQTDLPLVGICFGVQSLNVYRGGSLVQDIPAFVKDPVIHDEDNDKPAARHVVRIAEDSLVGRLAGHAQMDVNSYHHQSIAEAGRNLRAVAFAPDGVVE